MDQAGPRPAPEAACLDDVRRAASTVLSPEVWDFVEGGSGNETALAANRAAFDAIALLPRVLTGASTADTTVTLFGAPVSMPVAVAPMAYQRLLHPAGERAAAEAAARVGVPYIISTLASCRFDEIAAAGDHLWFQLYWLRERDRVTALVRTAEEIGCRALLITVDMPVMATRYRDIRNQFTLPPDVVAVNLEAGPGLAHRQPGGGSAVATHTAALFAGGLTWQDLEWLRERTRLPLVVKGILDPLDAERALACGADAVVVSNHGGRQSDLAVASVAALPEVLAAVGGRAPVLLDSGVRSGADVLRALALGAAGVLLGRPVLWGLATAGASGVETVLSLLRTQLREAMILTGAADLAAAAALRTSIMTHR